MGSESGPGIIGGGLKLLGGLFGKKKSMTPSQSIVSTAHGARKAAEKYGFNALTLLQSSNATAGAGMDMGTPPLASLAVLGDIVEDQFGDEAKTRREHNELQNELLRLEVDRARSLSAVAPPTAVGGSSLNGGYAVEVTASPRAGAPFLDEDDRGEARVDERDATASVQSHGQETVVPVGPDLDEIMTGVFINNVNRNKAARERLARAGGWTKGSPLVVPGYPLGSGLGGYVTVPDYRAVLPPKPPVPPAAPIDLITGKPVADWWKQQFPN